MDWLLPSTVCKPPPGPARFIPWFQLHGSLFMCEISNQELRIPKSEYSQLSKRYALERSEPVLLPSSWLGRSRFSQHLTSNVLAAWLVWLPINIQHSLSIAVNCIAAYKD